MEFSPFSPTSPISPENERDRRDRGVRGIGEIGEIGKYSKSVFNYFDDFGPFAPDIINLAGFRVFLGFTTVLGALMKDGKSQVDRALALLCLWGEFPNPDNDMRLRISLPEPKKEKWANVTHEFAPNGGDFP